MWFQDTESRWAHRAIAMLVAGLTFVGVTTFVGRRGTWFDLAIGAVMVMGIFGITLYARELVWLRDRIRAGCLAGVIRVRSFPVPFEGMWHRLKDR